MSKLEYVTIAIDEFCKYHPDMKKLGLFLIGMLTGVELFVMFTM